MGMESYQVVMRGGDATAERVRAALYALSGISPDAGFVRDSEHFLLRSGGNVFEFQLDLTPLRLSLRFALTHPPAVDAAFLSLVRNLMADTGLRVRVLEDDVPTEFADGYDLAHFDRFAATVMPHISEARRIWITSFGPDTWAGSTTEAWERVIHSQREHSRTKDHR